MNETKEVEKSQDKPPAKTREEALIDFRTAVEDGEQREKQGDEPSKDNDRQPLNPMADRHVLRCSKCGHFLCDTITRRAFLKMLCRQADCKALNEVTVDGNSIHYDVKPREARARGTMRL